MHDYIDTRSTISKSEKNALDKIRKSEKTFRKSISSLGVCEATDNWRERNNSKPLVIRRFNSCNERTIGVK